MPNPLSHLPSSLSPVLVRVDLNLPVQDGNVTDTTRIEHIKPTVEWLLQNGHSVILLSHFGRPQKKDLQAYSLKHILPILEEYFKKPITFIPQNVSPPPLKPSELALYENLRFDEREEKNDLEFARMLAHMGKAYVNDAFSVSHRAHASIVQLPSLLPAYMGLGLEKELKHLRQTLDHPQHPVAAIVGGAKISTKLTLLKNLMTKMDHIVIGGAMANTFLKAQGYEIGSSLFEENMIDVAQELLTLQNTLACQIHLPLDVTAAPSLKNPEQASVYSLDNIPKNVSIYDTGPKTQQAFTTLLKTLKTVLWNGPVGVFEVPPFDKATTAMAQAIAQATRIGSLIGIAGGGDTVAALNHAGCLSDFTYVSTAGGAFLEWLEGKELPGIKALTMK